MSSFQVLSTFCSLLQLLSLGLRDFFEGWYHGHISPDPVCTQEALEILHHVIKDVATRSKDVDYLAFFIETLMDDFMDHLKEYKQAVSVAAPMGVATCGSQVVLNEKIEGEFFRGESKDDPWRAVCCSREAKIGTCVCNHHRILCVLNSFSVEP